MKPQLKPERYLAKAHDHLIDLDNFHGKQITTFGAGGADSAGRQFKTLTGAPEDTRHFARCNRVDQTNYFEIAVEKNSVDGILHAEHVNAAARRYQKAFSGGQRRCTEQTFQASPERLGQTRTGGHCTAFSGVDETQSRLSRVYFQVALKLFGTRHDRANSVENGYYGWSKHGAENERHNEDHDYRNHFDRYFTGFFFFLTLQSVSQS